MQLLALLLGVVFSCCVFETESHAVVFESRTFDELVADADQIFVGTMVQAVSRGTPAGAIFTDYFFDDVEVVKGDTPSSPPFVTFLGGTIGDESLVVSGAPTFGTGVQYIVFVRSNGAVAFPTIGGPQGIFQVRSDAASNRKFVVDYGGRPLMSPTSEAGGSRSLGASPFGVSQVAIPVFSGLTLDEFVNEVRIRIQR